MVIIPKLDIIWFCHMMMIQVTDNKMIIQVTDNKNIV